MKYIFGFSLFLIYNLSLTIILEWDYINECGTAIASFDCERNHCIGKISNAKLYNPTCLSSELYQNEEFLQKLTIDVVFSIQSKFYNHIEGSTFDFWGTSKKYVDFKNAWTSKEVIELTKILDEKNSLLLLPCFWEIIIYDRITKENTRFKNKFKKLVLFLKKFILSKNLELPINTKNINELAYISKKLNLNNLAQKAMSMHLTQKGLSQKHIPQEIVSKIISYAFYKII